MQPLDSPPAEPPAAAFPALLRRANPGRAVTPSSMTAPPPGTPPPPYPPACLPERPAGMPGGAALAQPACCLGRASPLLHGHAAPARPRRPSALLAARSTGRPVGCLAGRPPSRPQPPAARAPLGLTVIFARPAQIRMLSARMASLSTRPTSRSTSRPPALPAARSTGRPVGCLASTLFSRPHELAACAPRACKAGTQHDSPPPYPPA
jgi:hypothetical protein